MDWCFGKHLLHVCWRHLHICQPFAYLFWEKHIVCLHSLLFYIVWPSIYYFSESGYFTWKTLELQVISPLPFVTCVGKTCSGWNPVMDGIRFFKGISFAWWTICLQVPHGTKNFILLQLMLPKHWTVFKFPWGENLSKDRSGLIIHLASKSEMCFQHSCIKSIFCSSLLAFCE